eukprot:365969-Chlamydomonas_euryale.AAC.5
MAVCLVCSLHHGHPYPLDVGSRLGGDLFASLACNWLVGSAEGGDDILLTTESARLAPAMRASSSTILTHGFFSCNRTSCVVFKRGHVCFARTPVSAVV